MMRGKIVCDCCLFGVGGLLIFLGFGLAIAWPYILQDVLVSNLRLHNNSKTYDMWIKTPIPMFLEIYLFNFTNAEEFRRNPKNVKPLMEEVGPFVFEEVHERVDVEWSDDEEFVSYNQTRRWTFLPNESLPLDSMITNLDLVSLTVSHVTKDLPRIEKLFVGGELYLKGGLFITRPVNQWLFDGMNVPILDDLQKIEKKIPIHFPIPFDKFGFFYQRNMSAAYDGRFKALTGAKDVTDLGMLVEWNEKNMTDFYPGTCGQVEGSSGEIFPPTAEDQQTFTLFISDVCSALKLQYSRDKSELGVNGREFVGDETMFGNNESIPEEACYCSGKCQPPGVRDVTKCRQGAPAFVSFPHFYLADGSYRDAVDGMSPNKSLHEFRLTIDQLTGIPVDVRAQIQVNALLKDYAGYRLYKDVPEIMIPMLWFSQRAQLTPELASQAVLLDSVGHAALPVLFILLSIGLVMVMTRAWLRYKDRSTQEDEEPIISDEEE